MRATQATTYRSILFNLKTVSNRLSDLQLMSATGKRITKPSDDPSAIRPMLHARSEITSAERYQSTMASGLDRINSMDGHFEAMDNVLMRVKEIALASINETLDAQNRLTYAEEVSQFSNELFDSANAQLDGKYLFSGYMVHDKPFVENPAYDPVLDPRPVLYQGDDGVFKIEIGPGEQVQINVTGNEMLLGDADSDGVTDPGSINVFSMLKDLETALTNNDPSAVEGLLDTIDQSMEQLRSSRSQMGNTGKRLENAMTRMEDTGIQMQEVLSRYEDADIVDTIAQLTQQETALQAALEVTGRISRLSILDFI